MIKKEKRKKHTFTFDENVLLEYKKYCEENHIYNQSKMLEWLMLQLMAGKLWKK